MEIINLEEDLEKMNQDPGRMIPFVKKQITNKSQQQFFGGQLVSFIDRWRSLGAPSTILKFITGTRIPLTSKPPMISNWKLSRFRNKISSEISDQINLLKEQKILEKPKDPGPSFISKIFLIPKSHGGIRPIFDLRNLNKYIRVRKIHLFSHFKMPEWIADILRSKGIRVVVYLDDFCLASQDKDKLSSQTMKALDLLEFLGWKINREKCILDPCQDIEFLGIQWNTKINRMSLPRKKANKIIALINKIKSKNF